MAEECIFCNIAQGKAPASVEYEDDLVVAFNDINPQAPVHILIVSKNHLSSIVDIHEDDEELIGHMVWVGRKLAENRQLEGYKLIFNVGKKGGQIIFHLHLHLLGGWEKKPTEVKI
ncbi:MAG: histidine triad nucleotide-binding protein [Patescibacteria group bacterium]